MKRQEIFDKIESIFEECDKRNIGSNETELDQQETITDWIVEKFGLGCVSSPLHFTKNEVDFAYCAGVFNTGGIDKLSDELNRLKELKKEPSDIILAARNVC